MTWIKKLFTRPTGATKPTALELIPGNHVYLLLFDAKWVNNSMMARVREGLHQEGITVLCIGVDDPERDITMLELEKK